MRPSGPILVTGCSSGIGRATVERLAHAGMAVYASARELSSIADIPNCEHLRLDMTDEDSMITAVRGIEAKHGAVGALVNNAGYSQSGALETVTPPALHAQFETNVFGLLRLSQLVLPGMRARGSGRIVNISSMGGRFTFPGGGAYHATKHAVEALSDAMRFEVAGFGIEVVVVQPGLIRTRFAEAAHATIALDDDDPYASFNAAVASRTVGGYQGMFAKLFGGTPDRVARVIERALTAKRPRTRYRVTPSAWMLIGLRRLVSDRGWDRVAGGPFPRPGRSG